MDLHKCTGQSAAATPRVNDLSDVFMFGFNVEDDGDRSYLTEVAVHGIGHEDDIKTFVRLGLLRGMEEWDQAVCCAKAMQEREYRGDSLDGQDVLAFLARIYGIEGRSCHDASTPSHRLGPGRPCIKRKRKRAYVAPDTQVALPAKKKQRSVKNERDSPYWDETRVSVRQLHGDSGEGLEARGAAKKAAKRRKGTLEGAIQPTSTIPTGKSGDDRSGDVPPTNTAGFVSKSGEGCGNKTKEEAPFKLDVPTIRASYTSDTNIEFAKPSSEQTEDKTHKPDRASGDTANPQILHQPETPKRKAKSPYFDIPKPSPSPSSKSPKKKRPPRGTVSCIPFPRLDAPRFGLIQEELASDPFKLLIAVTFLVRTSGKAAIPVFRALMDRYPTPSALADAPAANIVERIKHLGLGSVRAATIQRFARLWVAQPPRAGVRYVVRGYCCAEQNEQRQRQYYSRGMDLEDGVKKDEEGEGESHGSDTGNDSRDDDRGGDGDDNAMAWEIGHMTQGPYALDSWRIFCRDVLRGEALDWNGGGREGEFQPEWMRVLPRDKELRACLRWMWMREGWQWDPETGEKVVLPDALRRAVQEGRVAYDEDTGDLRILEMNE
ncbi:DNA glycosylase [Xylaria sp. FL0933]|nr:DNA glycosylase [Xylaria sp. FL0933]